MGPTSHRPALVPRTKPDETGLGSSKGRPEIGSLPPELGVGAACDRSETSPQPPQPQPQARLAGAPQELVDKAFEMLQKFDPVLYNNTQLELELSRRT